MILELKLKNKRKYIFWVIYRHLTCVEQSWWGWLVFRWPKLSFYLDGMPYLTRTIHFYFNGGSLIFSALMAWTHQAIVSIIIVCDTMLFLKVKRIGLGQKFFFIIINIDVRISLRVSQLILCTLNLITR